MQRVLNQTYDWANKNQQSFAPTKFQFIRVGKNDIKFEYNYYDNRDDLIMDNLHVKDLGIIIDADGTFKTHISTTLEKMKKPMGYLGRTFQGRDVHTLRLIWSTYIAPLGEYGAIIYHDSSPATVGKFESLLRHWTRRWAGQRYLSYQERLKNFNLSSMQRRNERFQIISTYKILEGYTPNPGLTVRMSPTKGRLLIPPKISRNCTRNTLMMSSYFKRGPDLWNSMPPYLRSITRVTPLTFKTFLDEWLVTIPDQPSCSQRDPAPTNIISGCNSNAITDWVPFLARNPSYRTGL